MFGVHGKKQNCPFVYLTYTFVSEKKYSFCKYTDEMKTLIIILVYFGAKYTIMVLDSLHKAFLISRIYKAFERGKTSGRSFVIGQRNEGKRSFIDFFAASVQFL